MSRPQPVVTGRTIAMSGGPREIKKSQRTRSFTLPTPKPLTVMRRVIVWIWMLIRYRIALYALASRPKKNTDQRKAEALAKLIAKLGGTAAYLGKQAGMRLDLLPLEYALALSRIKDPAPPIPLEIVIDKVEGALGAPLAEIFETFDPKPIASNTLDSVYQGIMRNGDKVAVRVLRPGAALKVNAERYAIIWVLGLLRQFYPAKNLLIERIQDEIPFFMLQGLDFIRRARCQRVLRDEIKRTGFRGFQTAKVYLDYSDEDVIISEFVTGVWLHEALWAVEHNDEKALEYLAENKIKPKKCARRLLRFSWWTTLESFVLLSAPHPSQLVIRPGGEIVLVELGAAITLSGHQRRLLTVAMEKFEQRDIEGAADLLLELVAPLPPVDLDELLSRVRGAMWTQLVAIARKDSPWWERSPTNFWLAFLSVMREFDIDVPMEMALAAQTQCVFGQLAFHIEPSMRMFPEFRRYRRRADYRMAVRYWKDAPNPRKTGGSRLLTRPNEVFAVTQKAMLSVESFLDQAPMTYLSMTHKGAASFSELLHLFSRVLQICTIYLSIKGLIALFTGVEFELLAELKILINEPLFIVALIAIALLGIRRVLFRLDDVDRDG